VALSGDPLHMHGKDYGTLARRTSEGDYLNIVHRKTADNCWDQFASSMDVYPTAEAPIIKEFFQML